MEKEEYTWNLKLIYDNHDAFYHDIEVAKKILTSLKDYRGILVQDEKTFLSFLENKEKLERLLNKLYCYGHLHCDIDPKDQSLQMIKSTILSLLDVASVELSFVDNEIIAQDHIIIEYLKNPIFKNYQNKINELLRYKPHILSSDKEEMLSKAGRITDLSSTIFDAMRLEFKDVIIDEKKHPLNSATLNKYLKNENKTVRQMAYHNFFEEYQRFENVFASTLAGVMQKDAFYSEIRNFKNPLEASVFDDDVPSELFHKVLNAANVKYRHLFHDYNKLKKQLLKLDTMHNYDLSVPLVTRKNHRYEITDSIKNIKAALKPFGQEYLKIIDLAFEERWIDFFPSTHKRMGAYSSGSYDTKPYILLNYIYDYNSMSTLMHELGHSVHSYLSNQNQNFNNASYRIFVAEVASIVNETLLMQHMIKNASTDQEKAALLYEQLESCVGVLYRQPMFADFEYKLHEMAANNEPLSSKIIVDLYTKLNQDYYGESVTLDDLTGYSCYYVPHFYYNFYVYKYTIGMTVALAIVQRILNGDQNTVEKYLQFLKSGSSASPIDLLTRAGVNPLDDQIYDDAFQYFGEILNQFKEIML